MSYGSHRRLSNKKDTNQAYYSPTQNEGSTSGHRIGHEHRKSNWDLAEDRRDLDSTSSQLRISNGNRGLSRLENGDHPSRYGDAEVNHQREKGSRADSHKDEVKGSLNDYLSRISQKISNNSDLQRYTTENGEHSYDRGPPLLSRSPSPLPQPTSPSSSYLDSSMKPSVISSSSPRKLLILDLNGTLVFRGVKSGIYRRVYPRPFMQPFRQYLFSEQTRAWLDVMIWSSAQPHNVVDMVDKCFVDMREYLVAIWGRDTLGLRNFEYSRKVQTTKDLDKPWSKLALEKDKQHSAVSTLLLDDSPAKAHLQPFNHVCLPEYDADRHRKDVASASAEIARSLLLEKIKGMENAINDRTVDEVEPEFESSLVPTSNTENTPSSTTNELTLPSHLSESKRRHSLSPRESTAEDIKPDKKRKKKKKSRFGPVIPDDVAESDNHGRMGMVAALPYDETLLAVIGILEESRQQSNVAGWIRSGGLWAGRYTVVKELSSAAGNVEGHSGSTEYSTKKNLSSVDDEDVVAFPPSSQTIIETDGEVDNESDHSAEKKGHAKTGTPLSDLFVAAGNDESTVAELSPEREIEESDNSKKGKAKEIQYTEDAKLPLWFENQEIVSYWAKRGRDALDKLGIPIIHGVRTS